MAAAVAQRVAVAPYMAGPAAASRGGCALIHVLIADDHAVFRMGLKTMLRSEPDLELVGEACSGTATVAAFQHLRPDVTVLDLRMPEGSGMHALRGILAVDSEARVLITCPAIRRRKRYTRRCATAHADT